MPRFRKFLEYSRMCSRSAARKAAWFADSTSSTLLLLSTAPMVFATVRHGSIHNWKQVNSISWEKSNAQSRGMNLESLYER